MSSLQSINCQRHYVFGGADILMDLKWSVSVGGCVWGVCECVCGCGSMSGWLGVYNENS